MNVFFTKNPNLKKSICCFFLFFFFFFLVVGVGWGGGRGGEGEGMASVSECFTKDPNKNNSFWRRRGWG